VSPRQRGVALLVAMLLLALMMVVGSSSLESAIVEYKVTGNMRDRSASFEGAEAATLQSFARLRQLVATGNSEPIESGGLYYGGRLPAVGGGSVTEIDSGSLKFWRTWGMPDDDTTMQTLLPSWQLLALVPAVVGATLQNSRWPRKPKACGGETKRQKHSACWHQALQYS
jgi:hypothetical protein